MNNTQTFKCKYCTRRLTMDYLNGWGVKNSCMSCEDEARAELAYYLKFEAI
jgi:hypothetical protein